MKSEASRQGRGGDTRAAGDARAYLYFRVVFQMAIDSPRGLVYTYSLFLLRGVAQLASALALGAKGRRFESDRPDHWWHLICAPPSFPISAA